MEKVIEQKPLDYYLNLKYPITITPDIDSGYVAEVKDLPGCFSQGETIEETYENIEDARRLWIESAYEDGITIPLPKTEKGYSGKFIIRVPKSLHSKLDELAEKEGVSLNQYLVSTLSHVVGRNETMKRRLNNSRPQ
jgi:predicted RNase H-like HicB family nuclease